jgi:hypothetical protein
VSDDPLTFLDRRTRGASKLLLDRYAVGETLTADELRRVEETLAADPEARAFVDEARLPSSLRPPVRPAPRRRWAPALGVLALAAALMLVTVLGPRTPGTAETSPDGRGAQDPGERIKGDVKLELVVLRNGVVSTALPDEVLHPGDAVRFRVSLPAARHVAIIGVDSAAAVSLYVPVAGAPMARVEASGHVFEGSIVLDGTLGPERFIAVFCEAPLAPDRLVAAATRALAAAGRVEAMAALALPCAQDSLVIRKAAP